MQLLAIKWCILARTENSLDGPAAGGRVTPPGQGLSISHKQAPDSALSFRSARCHAVARAVLWESTGCLSLPRADRSLVRSASDLQAAHMTTQREMPQELHAAVRLWKAAGEGEQPPSRWSSTVWRRQLPEYEEYLSTLPMPIGRAEVIARCGDAGEGPERATQAFIAAMIWGYGPVGYGGFRTKRVLEANEGAGDTLAAVARIAKQEGGPAAFAWLAQREHRLRWLGVAFATKYLFFCAAGGNGQPALVLDRLVRDWLFGHLNWPVSLEWNVADYRDYVDTVCTWAAELDMAPGNLEMLVFQLAANADPQSLWSAPELFASRPSATPLALTDGDPEDVATLLGILDEAEVMFSALNGTPDPEDVADFERGVRDLKRIVLARP
jgi:hypothetical protein